MTSAAIRMPVSGSGAIAEGRIFGGQFMVMQMTVFPKCYSCRDLHHLTFRRFNNITRSSRPDNENIGSGHPRTKPPDTHDLIISISPGRRRVEPFMPCRWYYPPLPRASPKKIIRPKDRPDD